MESLRPDAIGRRLEASGLEPSADEARLLAEFLNLLEQWNRVHNLTGIRDRAELIDRHLVESLSLEPYIAGNEVADIGSGAGLPGIPLAVRLPQVRFTLIESRRKRASFIRHAATALGLRNVSVVQGRAESVDLPPFGTVLARAVAPPAELLALASPLIAPGGRLVVLTGEDKGREISALADGFVRIDSASRIEGQKSRIVVLERKLS
jgi:16S rRNA (guanine527-N7)-methyltransferase